MKKNLIISLKLTAVFIIVLCIVYPLTIAVIGKFSAGAGNGEKIKANGKVVGYTNIGQQFRQDKYFHGRPSAVNYNAAGSGGSNKGPSNTDYLAVIQQRTDTFLAHNPGIQKARIPAELVTASGSGLDPDISPAGALIQVKRIAATRNIPEEKLIALVTAYTEKPLLGLFGPPKVNVLKLNTALDAVK